MLPSGWDSGPGSFSYTFSGSGSEYLAPFIKKKEVAQLINGTNPTEENIDKAYEIAQTIEIYYDRIYAIIDVSVAYTRLKTPEAFRKAYQATLIVSDQINVKEFLQQLTIMCSEVNSDEATNLANEIHQFTQKYICKAPF